jgi:thiamine pyrophosphate-dependent acetolactate synthase large subunit-like protein
MIDPFEATGYLLEKIGNDPVIGNLGPAKSTLYEANPEREANFYMLNSMGMACSIALGLAIARPDLKVWLLDGDGALLMNLGSLATEADYSPKNLVHIVWDNGIYQSTGGQPIPSGKKANIAEIARAAGFEKVARVDEISAFREAIDRAVAEPGPWFIDAKTMPSRITRKGFWSKPRRPAQMCDSLMRSIGSLPR